MAIKAVVRAALTASVAGAVHDLLLDMRRAQTKWGTLTDLPRSVLQTKDLAASGCGKDLPGYFTIDGLVWETSWRNSKVWNDTECKQTCDETLHCVGFTTKRGHGKVECSLHKGLHHKPDPIGMSYLKCPKGFAGCQDGFQFSHAGSWRNGKKMGKWDDEEMVECQKACRTNKGCVGFTHRVNKYNDTWCVHFQDGGNMEGAKRDSKATTYSKCVLEGQTALHVLQDNDLADENQSEAPEDDGVAHAPAPVDEQSEGEFVVKKVENSEDPTSADEQSQDEQSKAPASADDDSV